MFAIDNETDWWYVLFLPRLCTEELAELDSYIREMENDIVGNGPSGKTRNRAANATLSKL